MAWQPDDAKVQQLCQMFQAASSPSSQVQQQVMQALGQFRQLPDFNMYLVAIFIQMPSVPVDVRQRAGLLLKTNVSAMKRADVQPAMAEHISTHVLTAMKDPSKPIRATAGTILSGLVRKVGFSTCGQAIERLVQALQDPSQETLEGTLGAIGKICEDGVALLEKVGKPGADPVLAAWRQHEAQLFVNWANTQVLPKMLDAAAPGSPPFARQAALLCINFFALGGAFIDNKYGMQQHCTRYIEVLGTLANDTSPDILQHVCKGFACIIEDGWECLTVQHYQAILQFMLKASQNPEYTVRLEALAVWISCANQPDSWGVVKTVLQELVPVLIGNMVYADADYMILEPSQTENDNAGLADDPNAIKPRFHAESNNVDGDEDDTGKQDRASHGWGAEWTARKAAGASLDELSSVFPEIVQFVLPQIEQKLGHQSWEQQEAGVLALGAVAVHCQSQLSQFAPAVIGLLIKLCDASMPLLRSISCWCVSRFGQWIFHEQNPQRAQIVPSVLQVILPRCLDRNKRVQEAAIGALLRLAESGKTQLVPHLNSIAETCVKALQLYQLNCQRSLYDTVGVLAWACGPAFNQPTIMQGLVQPIFTKFETVPDNDILALPLCECIACLSQVLGQSLAGALPRIIMRCIKTINDTAMASQMWEQNPNEYERPQSELMASCCDLFSGMIEGLGADAKAITAQASLLSVVPLCTRNSSARVKQSGFWLMASAAVHCTEQLVPLLPELMPLCAAGLGPTMTMTVSINANRAIGEVCQRADVGPYLNVLVPALVAILQRAGVKQWQERGHSELLRNVCSTVNVLRQRSALGQQWPTICAQLPALQNLQQRFGLAV